MVSGAPENADVPFERFAHRLQDPRGGIAQIVVFRQNRGQGVIGLAQTFRSIPIGDRAAEHQATYGRHRRENLQEDQAVLRRRGRRMERPMALERAPDGDRRDGRTGQRRAGVFESQSRPDDERKHHELQRVAAGERRDRQREHHSADGDGSGAEERCFPHASGRGIRAPDNRRHEQHRRHEQRAGRIPQPPRPPQQRKSRPRLQSGHAKSADADRRADDRARHGRRENERGQVPQFLETMASVRVSTKQPHREHCLECVARRDRTGSHERHMRGDVCDQRAGPDRRPDRSAEIQDRPQRHTGGRPHGTDLFGSEGRPKTDFCGGDVDRNEHQRPDRIDPREPFGPFRACWGRHGCSPPLCLAASPRSSGERRGVLRVTR